MKQGMDWAIVVSSVTAFVMYCNTWDSGFVYDDNRAILSNDDVLPQTPLLDLLRRDFWGTPLEHSGSHGSYRPLAVLSFRLNVLLAGGHVGHGRARGFHVFNTLLHTAATAAFTRWVRVLTSHRRRVLTPWVSGMLFAVHPVHTEAVAGIVGRADVGASLFFTLSLLLYHEYVTNRNTLYLAANLLMGVCAMFTKEQGVTVFAVCMAYELVAHSSRGPCTTLRALFGRSHRTLTKTEEDARSTRRLLTLAVGSILSVGLRTWLTGSRLPTFAAADNPASRCSSFLTRAFTFFYLPAFNFGLLLYPSTLSFDWSMDSIPLITHVLDFRNVISFVFYSALIWSTYKHIIYLNCITMHNQKQETVLKSVSTSIVDVSCSNGGAVCKQFGSEVQRRPAMNLLLVFRHGLEIFSSWPRCLNSESVSKNYNAPFHHLNRDSYSSHCLCTTISKSTANKPKNVEDNFVRRQDSIVVTVGVAMMVIPFIPASNLVAYVGFVVAERVLYIPSLGFCLLVGHGFVILLEKLGDKRSRKNVAFLLTMTLILILIALAGRTIVRNRDWKSEEDLYRSGISVNPAKAYGNLGNILSVKGQYEEAEACYRKALLYRPNMADVHYNLGILLQSHQRFDESMHEYWVAIQHRPRLAAEAKIVLRVCAGLDNTGLRDPRTHRTATVACLFHLGRLAMEQGRLHEAVDVFFEAVNKRPDFYPPQSLFNMLGEAYSRLGRDAEAEPWFRASLSVRPDHVPAHLTYGKLLARNRTRIGEAEQWYVQAERLAPGDASVCRHYGQFLLAQKRYAEAASKLEEAVALSTTPDFEDVVAAATSLRMAGDFAGAERNYKLAISLRPEDTSSVANLGALYHLTGRMEDAEARYQDALRLMPEDDVTRTNLKRLWKLKAIQEEKQRLERK
ncbi:transmembrane and TPR repeat-containing protein 2-like isoform X2 [Zootermopsis nevadensis]|uniref:transmembrane and TPR repeat-containing protein 2-like isoform X2 n=1 Tax=Zootermopsis nevadensis TaxID=136037 RepID=UPI000B8EC442|nr:transmembrane and TPR repeat-containing protein 2-like isoform X2 [Zootermopsis nevadensis]